MGVGIHAKSWMLLTAGATHRARRRRFSSKIAGHTSILWITRQVKVAIGVYEDQSSRMQFNPRSMSALLCSCQLTISFGSPVIQEEAGDRARGSFHPPMLRYHNHCHGVEEVYCRPVIAYKITRAVESSFS